MRGILSVSFVIGLAVLGYWIGDYLYMADLISVRALATRMMAITGAVLGVTVLVGLKGGRVGRR